MTDRATRQPGDDAAAPAEPLRAAFRDLHGARLHGFALLLALGDRALAASLASGALRAGAERIDELRHPERAATWLRRWVVERVGTVAPPTDAAASGALFDLGADAPVATALAALRIPERAALIASTIERLDRRDVGVIVGRDGPAIDRLIRRARARYIDAYAAVAPDASAMMGPIVSQIAEAARAALA